MRLAGGFTMRSLPILAALIAAGFLASTLYAAHVSSSIDTRAHAISDDADPSIELLTAARTELRALSQLTAEAFLGESAVSKRAEVTAAEQRLDEDLQRYLQVPTFPGERAYWDAVDRGVRDVQQAVAEAFDRMNAGDRAGAEQVRAGPLANALTRADGAIATLVAFNAAEAIRLGVEIRRTRDRARTIAVSLDVVVGVLAIALTLLAWRAVSLQLGLARDRAALAEQAAANAAAARDAERRRVQDREDLLAMVSHDLRTPLTVVNLAAEGLARTAARSANGDLERSVARIRRSVRQMSRLIGDLLTAARIDQGKLELDVGRHDVRSLVAEALDAHLSGAESRGIHLAAELPPELPPARCDRDRVLQVLSNLVGNALKFTPLDGTITVKVAVAGDRLRFGVRDTGAGIEPEALPHVFERYWQRPADRRLGTGLGLYIARTIVEAHGGRIWAESRVGQGSTFTFEIPIASESAPQPERPPPDVTL